MKPTLKMVVLMTYLIFSFQKFDPVRHKKINGRQWDPNARRYAIKKSHGSSLEDCFSYK